MGASVPAGEALRSRREPNESDCWARLLRKQDSSSFEPSDVKGLLAAHEVATGISHELVALSDSKKVQHLLSSKRHEAAFKRLKSKLARTI